MPQSNSSTSDELLHDTRSTSTAPLPEAEVATKARGPGPYKPGTTWKTWAKLFKFSLEMRNIKKDNSKKLFLFQEVGTSNFELLESLLQNVSLESATFQQCLELLEKHFSPRKLVLAERYKMLNMVQNSRQSLQEFYADLQRTARDCEFESISDIRDAYVTMLFIGGITCVDTRKRLLEKESLTSKEALEHAEAFQRVGKNAPHLKEASASLGIGQIGSRHLQREQTRFRSNTPHHRQGGKPHPGRSHSRPGQGHGKHNSGVGRNLSQAAHQMTCHVCGKTGHLKNQCYQKHKAFCTKCRKNGHLAAVCKDSRHVAWCEEQENGDEDSSRIGSIRLHNRNSHQLYSKRVQSNVTDHQGSGAVIDRTPKTVSTVTPVDQGRHSVIDRLKTQVVTPIEQGCHSVIGRLKTYMVTPMEQGRQKVLGLLKTHVVTPMEVSLEEALGRSSTPSAEYKWEKVSADSWHGGSLPPALTKPELLTHQESKVALGQSLETQEVAPVVDDEEDFVPSCMLKIQINGKTIPCELDTGACISIIDRRVWIAIGEPPMSPPTSQATAYNGTPIDFIGRCKVKLEFHGSRAEAYIHVLDNKVRPLCGRDMIRALSIDCGPHLKVNDVSPAPKAVPPGSSVPKELERILRENELLFTPGLGKCTTIKASLKLKDDIEITPKFFRPRSIPFALRPKVEERLEEMVKNGILRKVEHSNWATPLVVVPKPGNNVRICGDYKVTVNPVLDINQYPLPVPDDMFHQLNGGQKFSKMDLSDAYMQVELEESDREFTTINTPKGLFQYTRVPFGIASAPAIFQRIMENTLSGLEGVLVYLDDITVTAANDHEHLTRLEKVLFRLNKAGFKLKKDKCEFLKTEMEFLGHVVDKNGIRPNPKKLTAMINMPEPKDVKGIESFLGMVQYYGKFVPNLSTLAAPVNGHRKKDVPWVWGKTQQDGFNAIKKRLTQADVLTHYDPKVPVVLATDASDYGIGAVVYHTYPDKSEKVIAYASRSLTKEERNYAQIEKEALGIVYGVEKFTQFLYGRKFTLLTDHQPLVRIFGPKQGIPVIAAKRLHRWGLRLMAYSFDIEYRRTTEFGNADGLSRLPDPRELPSSEMVIAEVQIRRCTMEILKELPLTEINIAQATAKDKVLLTVKGYVEKGWPPVVKNPELRAYVGKKDDISVYNGCLIWEQRVVIPPTYRKKILEVLHSNHYGRNKMIALARMKVWYPGIDADISKMSQACEICAAFANNPGKSPLHPWEEPKNPWQRLHMDFCQTEDGRMWLVVVDAKSKWPTVISMKSTTTSKTVERLQALFSIHGLPEQIVSDNGPQFASKEFREYCESRNIELTLTPPYHPNSNGEAERFVQTFKNALYKSLRAGRTTEQAVIDLMFQYRATPHVATGKSPAEVLMGRKLRTTLDIIKSEKGEVPHNTYRQQMTKNYGGKRTVVFKVGQEVYLRNYRNNGDKRLPGIITARTGQNQYEVHYGTGSRLCHTDQLKMKVTWKHDYICDRESKNPEPRPTQVVEEGNHRKKEVDPPSNQGKIPVNTRPVRDRRAPDRFDPSTNQIRKKGQRQSIHQIRCISTQNEKMGLKLGNGISRPTWQEGIKGESRASTTTKMCFLCYSSNVVGGHCPYGGIAAPFVTPPPCRTMSGYPQQLVHQHPNIPPPTTTTPTVVHVVVRSADTRVPVTQRGRTWEPRVVEREERYQRPPRSNNRTQVPHGQQEHGGKSSWPSSAPGTPVSDVPMGACGYAVFQGQSPEAGNRKQPDVVEVENKKEAMEPKEEPPKDEDGETVL